MPPDSRTARAINGPPWGDREELLAITVEQLQWIASLLHRAWFKGPHPEVIPLPRPQQGNGSGDGRPVEMAEPPKMSTHAEILAFFQGDSTKVVVSDS